MTQILPSIEQLAGLIAPGALLAIPPDYSGVSIAATKELIRQNRKPLRLLAVPTSGLQADLLIGAGLVSEVEAAAITLGEIGLAPRFVEAVVAGQIKMRDSTCPAVHAALQAKEKGLPFIPLRGLLESDIQRHRKDWKVINNPFGEKDPIVLLPALQPDVALFHAAKADRDGNVWIGRRRELVTMAHAAKATLVTVEEIVEGSLLADEVTAAGVIPSLYITAIALAPQGARPLGLLDIYQADDRALAAYAKAAKTKEGFDHWLEMFLAGEGT